MNFISNNLDSRQKKLSDDAGQPLYDLIVVDDDDISLEIINRKLRRSTFLFNCIECPQKALTFLLTRQTRHLIVDYRMPSLNGLEMIEALKVYPLMAATTVFLTSTVALPKQVLWNAQQLDIQIILKDKLTEDGFLEHLLSSSPV